MVKMVNSVPILKFYLMFWRNFCHVNSCFRKIKNKISVYIDSKIYFEKHPISGFLVGLFQNVFLLKITNRYFAKSQGKYAHISDR